MAFWSKKKKELRSEKVSEDEFIGMIRKPNCEITTQDNVTKLFDIDE